MEQKPINVWQLEEFAKDKGFNSVTFIGIGNDRLAQGKFLDAYFGFVQLEGTSVFCTLKQLREVLGDDAKYVVTGGCEGDEEDT